MVWIPIVFEFTEVHISFEFLESCLCSIHEVFWLYIPLLNQFLFCNQVLLISRGQRQIVHQIDNLSRLLHEYYGDRSHQERTDPAGSKLDIGSIGIPLLLSLAVGGIGILLLKTISSPK